MELQEKLPMEQEPVPMVAAAKPVATRSGGLRFRDSTIFLVLKQTKAQIGLILVLLFVGMAIFAPLLTAYVPETKRHPVTDARFRKYTEPNSDHLLGTSGGTKDVFTQLVYGARPTLLIGFITGLLAMALGLIIGMTAGYFGGIVDELLSLLTNVFLLIPLFPLMIVIFSILPDSTTIWPMIFALGLFGWAWPARIFRSQMLSLREKDFVSAALVSGEGSPRIIFREILPNMTSIVVGSWFGSTIFAVNTSVALLFIGVGNTDENSPSWGTMLFWAQNNQDLALGKWWTFVPVGICVALLSFALAMINYAMDEITNPRLRAEKEISRVLKKFRIRTQRAQRATPVIRQQI